MSSMNILLDRNRAFAENFDGADLPILPKMRSVIVACGDSRVDPAHILGLELGDAVVIRNNGGRVTPAVIDEIAALAFIVKQMDGDEPGPFELILLQHTQCGAERFADPGVQSALKEQLGVDVSQVAITNHEASLHGDIERLRMAPEIPGYIVVSAFIYDMKSGGIREVVAPIALAD
ncbi:carbonic anhydrase [Oricola cellulosilytica]|uniref:Carbonic anhydrase n=1 Tax=Oricola cellulosilytica TaxID=1429082 RepID=A0A4R0PBJ7_9HYPH|nr:carbonic anhydrase [Oricola cellulosilytica]TCD14426.1 carbonic anhydrase [Oricola cellulosilytica]